MPIKVPDNLPAQAVLEDEGVLLINEGAALRQDVRPLEIALLNLLPDKIKRPTISVGAPRPPFSISTVCRNTNCPKSSLVFTRTMCLAEWTAC